MNQIIIQGIGFIALFFVLLSFQKQMRVSLLLAMLTGLILFVIHFCLLQAWTGALMNLVEAAVVFVAYKKETSTWAQKRFWPYVLLLLYVTAGIATAKTTIDILPVVAQIVGAIAVWQTKPRMIRFLMLVPRPLWFIYNMVIGSYAGMAAEVFILASVLIGIIRFDILGKKQID